MFGQFGGLAILLWFTKLCASSSMGVNTQVGGAPSTAMYTKNTVCVKSNCVNPVIPGLMQFGENVMTKNSNISWKCTERTDRWKLAGICKRVVLGYHFAVPDSGGGPSPQEDPVLGQAKKALVAYVAHLAGIGFDFWDYKEPWKQDDCIQSIWKMACYTYFPLCNQVEGGKYLRPCKSSCENFLASCKVRCCDEGTQCVFTHHRMLSDGTSIVDEGYANHHGPSPMCTGAAAKPMALHGTALLAALMVVTLFACEQAL